MASIPLVALSANSQQPSPLDQYGKMMSLQNLLQQRQSGAIDLQQKQQALSDQKATTTAMQQWDGQDYSKLPSLILKNGGSANAVFAATQHIQTVKEKISEIAKNDATTGASQLETVIKNNDQYRGRLQSIIQAPADKKQQLWADEITSEEKAGKVQPGQMSHTYPGDDQATVYANHFALGSVLAKEANELKVATIRAQGGKEGELALGPDRVTQMNQAMTSRYQILNPGKALPSEFTLPANATQKDYDRIDKALESTEKASGTKAQQDTANAMREQTAQLAQQARSDAEEKEGLQPVTGTDPKSGKTVLVSQADAKKMGLTETMKADADLVNKSQAARHWLQLADKQGDSPETMGITQLIDKLDKDGKLGTVASRWNEFLAGKVGAGDPEYAALRTKMGLSATKLMQAHVGSRGGSFMLEHFEDLANAKKMNAATLRAGVQSELNYMQDVAMQPQKAGGASGKPATLEDLLKKYPPQPK